MACWRASVDAAEARRAEVASVEAVLKPIPSLLTGSVACSHWVSSILLLVLILLLSLLSPSAADASRVHASTIIVDDG